LLAKALGQAMAMLNAPAPSRASPLPQGVWLMAGMFGVPTIYCGSGLAHESAGSGDGDVECAAAFASKPAPTGGLADGRDGWRADDLLWEWACSRKRWVRQWDVECAGAFASKPAPTGGLADGRDGWRADDLLWEWACSRKRWVRQWDVECAGAFASKPAPTGALTR